MENKNPYLLHKEISKLFFNDRLRLLPVDTEVNSLNDSDQNGRNLFYSDTNEYRQP
jgi:hypothetical protein